MEKEKYELLLKDLACRLPYGVKVSYYDLDTKSLEWDTLEGIERGFVTINGFQWEISDVKPFLFPMSSMTIKQKNEFKRRSDTVIANSFFKTEVGCVKLFIGEGDPHEGIFDYIDMSPIDWLNRHHYDYRGLIEEGLAIDCSKLNIY